ncbi:hypothetical protein B0H13DRAFT_1853123 [Mycena leptocephala]|nr:hypothetical protein B0H13DRAFT_1853123 [Mycena leptocephala]
MEIPSLQHLCGSVYHGSAYALITSFLVLSRCALSHLTLTGLDGDGDAFSACLALSPPTTFVAPVGAPVNPPAISNFVAPNGRRAMLIAGESEGAGRLGPGQYYAETHATDGKNQGYPLEVRALQKNGPRTVRELRRGERTDFPPEWSILRRNTSYLATQNGNNINVVRTILNATQIPQFFTGSEIIQNLWERDEQFWLTQNGNNINVVQTILNATQIPQIFTGGKTIDGCPTKLLDESQKI